MRWALLLAALLPRVVSADETSETKELVGQVGSRSALMVVHATQRPDGGWQLTGEYVLLPTLARRFVEGERSPELFRIVIGQLARCAPSAQRATVPNAGHAMHRANARFYDDTLSRFLADHGL